MATYSPEQKCSWDPNRDECTFTFDSLPYEPGSGQVPTVDQMVSEFSEAARFNGHPDIVGNMVDFPEQAIEITKDYFTEHAGVAREDVAVALAKFTGEIEPPTRRLWM